MKTKHLFLALALLLGVTQASAYTIYFHPNHTSANFEKFAVWSWADDYENGVWSEFMTPVDGHDGWFVTEVTGGDNFTFYYYKQEAATPADWSDGSYSQEHDATKTYYYDYMGWMEDMDGRLLDGRIISDNILFNVDDENKTAEVAWWQGDLDPKNITIPSTVTWKTNTYTVTSIAGAAYEGSESLTSISLPNTIKTIGGSAFYGCSNLTSFTIPEGVESIGSYAFGGCPFTSITIPKNVKSIEWNIFGSCQSLTDVTLAEGLTVLGGAMFSDCNALEHITIPNSIKELPGAVLADCDNLVSVTLGTGVDTIGENAFSNCENLARLTIYAANPPAVNDDHHPELVSTCSLMVPSSVKAAYQAHPYWSQFTIKGIYIVTFKDFSGNTIKTEAVEQGKSATAPDAPLVDCYTFTGWDKAFSNITADITVNAVYTQNVYTVTFMNGSVQHDQQNVNCGSDAAAPANPTKEGYHFTGWDKAFTDVHANLVVNAQFAINTYTVTFKDIEGNTIGEPQVVDWNTAAEAPEAPAVECNHFIGWDKAFDHVQADLTVTALYAINQYEVKFLNWNGAELKKQTVDCGDDAEAPANPSRDGHTFTGWDIAFTDVHANLVVTAQFAINTYDVVFQDYNGSVLKEAQKVNWHEAAIAPADPTREGYAFTGWDTDFSSVEANLVVTATYEILTFKVVFKDYDGTILKAEQIVNWNEAAIAPEETPHRDYYTFTGWDKEFEHVTSDLVITAQYEPGEEADITVQFFGQNGEGEEIAHTDVVIRIPAAPEIEGFTFQYWRPVAERINGVIRIEAVYTADDPTAAPEVYTNPANPAQKIYRNGSIYILSGDKTYTITGELVR